MNSARWSAAEKGHRCLGDLRCFSAGPSHHALWWAISVALLAIVIVAIIRKVHR